MTKIIVDNLIRVSHSELSQSEAFEIRQEYTKRNPSYQMMRMTGLDLSNIPEYVKSYYDIDGYLCIPRGTGIWMRQFLVSRNHKIELDDKRSKYPPLDISLNFGVLMKSGKVFKELHPYQEEGRNKLGTRSCGIFQAKCGGGKTVTGLSLIDKVKQPTLILVHTGDLLSQWMSEINEKMLLSFPVAQYGIGQKNKSQITIATIQSLIRMGDQELIDFMASFGCVILDECHHAPAETFEKVLNSSKSYYRFGLTATPTRGDGLGYKMIEVIGPIIYKVDESQLKSTNLMAHNTTVRVINTNYFDSIYKSMNTKQIALNVMAKSEFRNKLILKMIRKDWEEGRFILALSQRVDHCLYMSNYCIEMGMRVGVLVGEVKNSIRKQIIEDSRSGLYDILIGTKVADEGLNVENLDTLHIMLPHSNKSQLEQQIGRIQRRGGQDPLVRHYRDLGGWIKPSNDFIKYCRGWGYIIEYENENHEVINAEQFSN